MLRAIPVAFVALLIALAFAPVAEAGQPCTTPPKRPVEAILWFAGCAVEGGPDPDPLLPEVAHTEVDLRWLNNCPGPWGHDQYTTVGPVTIVTYECDDGGV